MEITKQYHTKINTTNVKSAYNVSTVTRSLSDTVKEAKLVLHSIEVKTETPESKANQSRNRINRRFIIYTSCF